MNKINPLYILLLFVCITLISFVSLGNIKNDYKISNEELYVFSQNAREYNLIKNSWINKNEIKNRAKNVLRYFSSKDYDKSENKNSINIKFKTFNKKILSKFLNKILNQKFIFTKLEITQSTVLVQIRLK